MAQALLLGKFLGPIDGNVSKTGELVPLDESKVQHDSVENKSPSPLEDEALQESHSVRESEKTSTSEFIASDQSSSSESADPLPGTIVGSQIKTRMSMLRDEDKISNQIRRPQPAKVQESALVESGSPLEVINLVTSDVEQWEEEDDQDKKALPDLNDLRAFSELSQEDCTLFEEKSDSNRLLVWYLVHIGADSRERMEHILKLKSFPEVETIVWHALDAMRTFTRKVSGLSAQDSEAFMRIATCYVVWTQCKLPTSKDRGCKIEHIRLTINSKAGFPNFWKELSSRLRRIRKASQKPMSETGRPERTTRHKIQYDENDRLPPGSAKKKRTYVPRESERGADLRREGNQRQVERDRHREEQKKRLARIGADPSQMAVINAGHEHEIRIPDSIAHRIKSHQLEGVQFLWSEIVAARTNRQGCLLAHTMGLGKTMQV